MSSGPYKLWNSEDKKAKNLKALQSQQDFEKILKDQRNKDLTEQESETKS